MEFNQAPEWLIFEKCSIFLTFWSVFILLIGGIGQWHWFNCKTDFVAGLSSLKESVRYETTQICKLDAILSRLEDESYIRFSHC